MDRLTLAILLPSTLLKNQLIRFGIVGSLNTAFSYGVYSLGIFAGLSYYIASLLALVLGIAVSFITQGRLVFSAQLKGRFTSFLVVWSVLYVVNIGLIRLLSTAGLNYYIAGLVALFPVIILSFVLQKYFVFKSKGPNEY